MNESTSPATALPEVYNFDTLCTPHYAALVHYANRLIPGRPQEARDLVQEAFLRAFKRWSSWRPRTNEDPSAAARGWLHRVVQNVFIDEARAHIGRRVLLEDNHCTVIANTYGSEADHAVQVLSDGVGDEVREALDTLGEEQREIVLRADFQGEQYKVIAEALGVPMGTVMSSLHRGRKRLAGALQGYAKEAYGISKKDIVVKRSNRASSTTLPDVPAELPQTEPDRIDCVVAGHDGCDFLHG
jgi:RNA polymerase sigma-70 factor (ECF subfamily)